ncbi:MAG: DUF192 domain-containing protein [Candidatus Peribacteraceae bacterium]|nr:DUF192 domain-containing protein [Candidatus Peribacteraceae bacterium]MBP9850489.1 DUF192 domain-containing protein [Candidatus Peribacteraceae bacterium]
MQSKLSISVIITAALVFSACGTEVITLSSFDGTDTVTVNVEISDSPEEREEGLMNRESLKPDSGMLFVFKEPQMLSFWMKNTLIPLDIIFFDAQGNFVSALTMEPCTENPCPTYKAAALSSYALEVRKDYRKDHGIGTGWKLDLKEVQAIADPS